MTILQREFIVKSYRTLLKTGLTLSLALFGLCLSAAVSDTRAQQTPYYDLSTPEVTVDLSVLNDGGIGGPRVGAVSPSVGGGNLLMPGSQPPSSQLFVKPQRKPSVAPRAPQRTVKRKAGKPRAKSQPTRTASKPAPKPRTKPEKKKKAPSKQAAVEPKPDSAPVSAAPPPAPAIPGAPAVADTPPPPAPSTATAPTPLDPEKKTAAASGENKEQAAATPGTAAPSSGDGGKSVQIVFAETSAKVPGAMTAKLKSLATELEKKDTLRLQLKAYAGGKDMTPSKARR
ncbi:MAG: hypothetical protein RIB59_08245, partial [Rhodospirillales bacterium]